MTDEFDITLARKFRDDGILQVANNNPHFLNTARELARRIAKKRGTVTADLVRRNCPLTPHHPNAWGAVFKTKDFEWTGEYKQSALVQGHGNMQRVWRLKHS